ncbi:Gfo/Idh/MocA family protein [Halovulum sp. GXIMD14794]
MLNRLEKAPNEALSARPLTMRVGLIGAGFMGKAHCIGFGTAARVFDLPVWFELDMVAEASPDLAERARRKFGFARATGDWRELVADPQIDIVDIAAPNRFHREIAIAAARAGKHIYCEKPLAPTADDARLMAEAAKQAGVLTQVGFNYLANPMIRAAKEIIGSGEIGEIYSYRGVHAEDYMADPASPWTFRHDPVGGGALADIGSHAIATAELLLGPIAAVAGRARTVHRERPDGAGGMRVVEVDDVTHALVEFESGVTGTLEANWLASGRTMQHDFEVFGSKGALRFSQERLNELQLYVGADSAGRRGFRRIEAGPDHPPYGAFCMAPGHQIGFNDLKAIEILEFSRALAGQRDEPFGFAAGFRNQRVIAAILMSSTSNGWVQVDAG